MKPVRNTSKTKGFAHAASLMQGRIRKASADRGFAASRLLTHWAEVVGAETAAICRPVEVSYGKGGMGATLTLLTTGPQAPMLEMRKEQIREKVNACYGYNAITRLRLTQTAATGFAEGRATFAPAPAAAKKADPALQQQADALSAGVRDDRLRAALAALGTNVLTKEKS